MTQMTDAHILADWRAFIRNGFRQAYLTEPLCEYLAAHCDPEQRWYQDPAHFWQEWFDKLYDLHTFLTDICETDTHDPAILQLRAELEPYYADLKDVLDDYERQVYIEVRDDEIAANLDQACQQHPHRDRAEVEQELIDYYDACMPEWFYADYYAELELSAEVYDDLSQVVTGRYDPAWQPSVFDLNGWMIASDQPDKETNSAATAVQINLLETAAQRNSQQVADKTDNVAITTTATLFDTTYPTALGPEDKADAPSMEEIETLSNEAPAPPSDELEAIKRRLAATPEEEAAMKIDPRIHTFHTANVIAYR